MTKLIDMEHGQNKEVNKQIYTAHSIGTNVANVQRKYIPNGGIQDRI